METLGQLITRLMDEKGWSAKELARRCTVIKGGDKPVSGTHINRLSKDEVENPGMDFIRVVAIALNVDPMQLYAAFIGRNPQKDKGDEGRKAYKDIIKQFFEALPTEDKLELLGPASNYFKNELLKQEKANKPDP